ncbi:MAG: DUF3109 family protein [Bacteroidales bacterium]|nr:DUF3109 family protein [Bacteroidales bacterium]
MVEIGDTLVSFQLFETHFLCPLHICKGQCCIDGDAGAPLTEDEAKKIEKILPVIWPTLSKEAQETINQQGVAYYDKDGDLVTTIVNNANCAFTCTDKNGICGCAIEKAFREGKIDFMKPISCHLYPVRLNKYQRFTAVNLHRWEICDCAVKYGKEKGVVAYQFLKEPLIRCFGEAWYHELEQAAADYENAFKKL